MAGVWLLTVALIDNPSHIVGLAQTRYLVSPTLVHNAAVTWVRGVVALPVIVVGFALQVAGTIVSSHGPTTLAPAASIGIALAAIALVAVIWRCVRIPLLRQLLRRVASIEEGIGPLSAALVCAEHWPEKVGPRPVKDTDVRGKDARAAAKARYEEAHAVWVADTLQNVLGWNRRRR